MQTIDGIPVLLGPIPFSECIEYHSVHSAPDSRMNRMNRIRFARNTPNTCSFGEKSNAAARDGLLASGWKT